MARLVMPLVVRLVLKTATRRIMNPNELSALVFLERRTELRWTHNPCCSNLCTDELRDTLPDKQTP